MRTKRTTIAKRASHNDNESSINSTKQRIIKALENPKYKWRTVSGVSKEISLPTNIVLSELNNLKELGIVVQSSKLDFNGRYIYTTRKRYNKRFANRLFSALTDKII